MFGSVLVVPDPGAQPSRAERGTNVHIVPRLEWKDAESPHADAGGAGGREHKRVSTGSPGEQHGTIIPLKQPEPARIPQEPRLLILVAQGDQPRGLPRTFV
jgi:hypothetical protein